MKRTAMMKTLGCVALVLAAAMPVWAASAQDVVGDWSMERVGAGMQAQQRGGFGASILSLSLNKEGKLTGQMIGMMGITELNDVKFENGTLSFSQTLRMRQEEAVSRFTGTLRDGKLTGTQSNQRGEVQMEGTRAASGAPIIGEWEITTTRGEQQMVTILAVSPDKDGKMTVTWRPQRGQAQGQRTQADRPQGQRPQGERPAQADRPQGQRPQGERPAQGAQADRPQGQRIGGAEMTDVEYKDGKLSFTRRMMMGARGQQAQQGQQQERVTRYVVSAKGDVLTGTLTNPQGEQTPINGKRAAASPLAGTWMLTVSGERGERTQRLVVYPDMSGLYGPMAVDNIAVENNDVSFSIAMSFGDRTIENAFKGKLDGDKLVGRMSTTGFDGQAVAQDVTGKKL